MNTNNDILEILPQEEIKKDYSVNKKKKKKLIPEEKEAKIQFEREAILKMVHSGDPNDTKEKVALIISRNIHARNSDIELAWDYFNMRH